MNHKNNPSKSHSILMDARKALVADFAASAPAVSASKTEIVFAPIQAVIKKHQEYIPSVAASALIESRIKILGSMGDLAASTGHFVCKYNLLDSSHARTTAIGVNGNVQHVDRGIMATMIEEIRKEAPVVQTFLEDAGVSADKISMVMEEHAKAATNVSEFFKSILQGQKITPRLQPAL